MARTVTDLAKVLEVMVGYDPEDPLTAIAVGQIPASYTSFLDRNGLKGARIGLVREPIGGGDPASDDFKKVDAAFQKAVQQLEDAGALVVDPIVIPDMRALVARRNTGPEWDENIKFYLRSPKAPFHSREEIARHPDFPKVAQMARGRLTAKTDPAAYYQHLLAREALMFNVMKVMADHRLDAIAYKSIEHQPRLIRDVVANTPNRGVPTMSTFLGWVPTITVPAGFTSDGLPIGITFQGRPFGDGTLLRLAYGFEQATRHRRPPQTVPALE
jgi:Asp-tRNA(Asn)/Glu-tRNA(Gln) amidotransferase A subunit family amidase